MSASEPEAIGELRAGSRHFEVTELPAYEPSGEGEHCYVWIEKEGLTTDQAVNILGRAGKTSKRGIGFAGRKDRHGITRQWISLQLADPARLENFEHVDDNGRLHVLALSRHRNKLRTGHLAGNRFRIGLQVHADHHQTLVKRVNHIATNGVANTFGAQRFGHKQSSLKIARAWAGGDIPTAIAWCVDAEGHWQPGDPLPPGFRSGPTGPLLGSLRKHPDDFEKALKIAGDSFRKLIASAAQAAIFNAVWEARQAAGRLHRLTTGEVALSEKGAPFTVTAEKLAQVNAEAAPGVLQAFATGPMPGQWQLGPSAEHIAEEQSWSAATGMQWDWFNEGQILASPGLRRALVVPFLEAPAITAEADELWLSFALPRGAYATEVLEQIGITVPTDRSGLTRST